MKGLRGGGRGEGLGNRLLPGMNGLALVLSLRQANEFEMIWMTPGLLLGALVLSQWAGERSARCTTAADPATE